MPNQVRLSDEAIRLNPSLAEAHVPKARAFVRASMYPQANVALDAALAIDPTLSGAYFLRAEVFRRTHKTREAEQWYQKFIDSTSSTSRKANGYSWIATMYSDEAWSNEKDRPEFLTKARVAHERGLELEPDGAWRNVNFAIFLNGDEADFDSAERFALRALQAKEFRMARYHLAAARYQKLWAKSHVMSGPELKANVAAIANQTRVSLEEAMAFSPFGPLIEARLTQLRARSQMTNN